ncbi:MAG TPA: alpha/beta fold hydrolase [Microvirga sp.]|jgi:pimeloyl-ACP methyl ester carboxylesterase|nr:alpha/beta fold hydrolase [Microvirga sp.]
MSPILPPHIRREAEGRPLVIALHCSGGTGRQWRALAEALGPTAPVVAPDLVGTPDMGPWCGSGPFTLRHEAEPVVDLIDSWAGPVHLVGHSYGGGVALQVAALRASRIASLALYEPCAFHLLPDMGAEGVAGLREIQEVARAAETGLLSGAYQAAAERFVDYWNGTGTWAAMKPRLRAELVAYLPKACLDFRALFTSRVRLEAYRRLDVPVLVLQGEHAPRPTVLIARRLHAAGRRARFDVVRGAGHMGPVTHAAAVAALIGAHVRAAMPSSNPLAAAA